MALLHGMAATNEAGEVETSLSNLNISQHIDMVRTSVGDTLRGRCGSGNRIPVAENYDKDVLQRMFNFNAAFFPRLINIYALA